MLSPFWRTEMLEAGDEAAIIKEFGRLIPAADHRFRMERMLYADRANSAHARRRRWPARQQLADAWAAVLQGRQERPASCSRQCPPRSVRPAISSPRPNISGAARNSPTPAAVDAEGAARRGLAGRSRRLVDRAPGAVARARRPAATSRPPTGSSPHMPPNARPTHADAEFHAGWYALRGLNDPKTAATHFARIAGIADGPMSLSRAYYWLGRAAEAGGPGNANAYYQQGGGVRHRLLRPARGGQAGRPAARSPSPIPSQRRRPAEFRQARGGQRHQPAGGRRLCPRAPTRSTATSPGN